MATADRALHAAIDNERRCSAVEAAAAAVAEEATRDAMLVEEEAATAEAALVHSLAASASHAKRLSAYSASMPAWKPRVAQSTPLKEAAPLAEHAGAYEMYSMPAAAATPAAANPLAATKPTPAYEPFMMPPVAAPAVDGLPSAPAAERADTLVKARSPSPKTGVTFSAEAKSSPPSVITAGEGMIPVEEMDLLEQFFERLGLSSLAMCGFREKKDRKSKGGAGMTLHEPRVAAEGGEQIVLASSATDVEAKAIERVPVDMRERQQQQQQQAEDAPAQQPQQQAEDAPAPARVDYDTTHDLPQTPVAFMMRSPIYVDEKLVPSPVPMMPLPSKPTDQPVSLSPRSDLSSPLSNSRRPAMAWLQQAERDLIDESMDDIFDVEITQGTPHASPMAQSYSTMARLLAEGPRGYDLNGRVEHPTPLQYGGFRVFGLSV